MFEMVDSFYFSNDYFVTKLNTTKYELYQSSPNVHQMLNVEQSSQNDSFCSIQATVSRKVLKLVKRSAVSVQDSQLSCLAPQ